MEAVDLISAFLDENGYKSIQTYMGSSIGKNYNPKPGEYFVISNTLGIITHMQVFTRHDRWELTLGIFDDGLVNIHINKNRSPDVLDRVELPTRKVVKLSDPKSLEVFKRLL